MTNSLRRKLASGVNLMWTGHVAFSQHRSSWNTQRTVQFTGSLTGAGNSA